MRRAPDDPRRIAFGGLSGGPHQDLSRMAARLRERLLRIFPPLADARKAHVWTGRCAGTCDLYPPVGSDGGIHYAAGYRFAGVPMGTGFGRKVAERVLGRDREPSVFAGRPLAAFLLYRGNACFMP